MELPAQPQPPPPSIPTTTTTTTTATAQWNTLIPPPTTALSLLPQFIHSHQSQPKFPTGCPDLDRNVLRGGFNGSSIVGISSEDEDLSLTLALQTITLALLPPTTEAGPVGKNEKTALIVSTLPAQTLVPKIRAVLVGQLSQAGGDLKENVRGCLSRIEIARVFDLQGLGEVVDELLRQDARQQQHGVVLVMGMAMLMSSFFTAKSHDKMGVYGFVGGLGGRLEGIVGREGGGGLVVLLNSTTSSHGEHHADAGEERKMEAGMTSVLRVVGGQLRERGGQVLLRGDGNLKRRESRPAWGQVFGQLVGVHLLVTRLDVVERKGWVVEVLGDEVGVYECSDEGTGEEVWTRRSREQRWGVVEVRDGRVVDVVL